MKLYTVFSFQHKEHSFDCREGVGEGEGFFVVFGLDGIGLSLLEGGAGDKGGTLPQGEGMVTVRTRRPLAS